MKRFFSHYLEIIMCLIFISCSQEDGLKLLTNDNGHNDPMNVSDREGYIQDGAFSAYEDLMSILNYESRASETSFSSWYGGSYINEEGMLVVRTTDMRIPEIYAIEDVIYEKCTYSEFDFSKIRDRIINLFDSGDSFTLKHIISFGVNPISNCYEIGLDELSEENISYFKENICSNPEINFIYSNRPVLTSTQLDCGSKIINQSALTAASLGYRAKKSDGTIGIVTAGHFISAGQILVDSKYNTVGECVDSYYMNGLIDAAFCKITNDSVVLTNKIKFANTYDSDTLSIDLAQPPVGSIINMTGEVSHRKSGTVYAASKDIIINNKTLLTDAILMTCNPQKGDSGGLVYALTTKLNKRYTVGIAVGTVNSIIGNDTTVYGICCKAYLINKLLQIERY